MNHTPPSGRAPALGSTVTLLTFVAVTCDRPKKFLTAPERTVPRVAGATVVASDATDPQLFVGAGDIASCTTSNDEGTAKLLDSTVAAVPAATVFALGDNAYPNGTDAEYSTCYGPTWGRHLARTYPTPGEKDYNTAGASGYFGYYGAAAGDPANGYYSYDIGASWHVVVLNSNLSTSAGSPQEQWLKADLAASGRPCTVALWHRPRFSSATTTVLSAVKPLWDALYLAGADLILNAHYRNYERFGPQRPDGSADPDFGVRQFIVGTGGGTSSSTFGTILPNSEARSAGTAGILKLTLDAGSYSWQFTPVAGKTYTDAGTGACHGPPPPVAKLGGAGGAGGGAYSSEGTVTFDGSASSDPQGDTPLSYAWDFGDGSSGTGAKPTHTYTADGVYTVTLVVTDSKGNSSAPATTTVTIANLPPTITASDIVTHPNETATLTMSVSDPGTDDAPWSYVIDWGDGTPQTEGSTSTLGTPFRVTHIYETLGQYAGTVTVTDEDGGVATRGFLATVNDPALAEVLVGAGDIAGCTSSNLDDEATATVLDSVVARNPNAVVFAAGDNAYESATAAELQNCYGPTWGRHRDRTYAVLGNHDYAVDPNPTWDYFGDRAGPRGLGYYSFDLGDWHIIVLSDNSADGGPARTAGSTQDQWLQADLAANTKRCTIAIWHQPYVASGWSTSSSRKIFWDRLYAAGAEIVITGHKHHYERMAPQTPTLVRDDARGIRAFVVGTGGRTTSKPTPLAANTEVVSSTRGVLQLTLETNGYTWQFLPVAGKTFTDSGSGACH